MDQVSGADHIHIGTVHNSWDLLYTKTFNFRKRNKSVELHALLTAPYIFHVSQVDPQFSLTSPGSSDPATPTAPSIT